MSLPCDIVMDLVSIYKDKLTSPKTSKEIEEHIAECGNCRRYYKLYDESMSKNSTNSEPEIVPEQDSYSDYNYQDVSKRLKRRHNNRIAIMSVVAGVAITLTAINVIRLYLTRNK